MVKLDQFYTKPEVADECWRKSLPVFEGITKSGDLFFVEPSAGDGVFYDLLPDGKRIGFDLEPDHKEVIKRDFIKCRYKSPADKKHTVVIGNPPFGLRGKLAVRFVNKALKIADTVGFIVPVIFRKYFIHKQLEPAARWVYAAPLPRCAFRTHTNNEYCVNTEFQVWTRIPSEHKDKRLFSPPPITHPDFLMFQYNNTKQALKMFNNPFDFAVPCQGYQDYTRRESKASKCEKNKQWMLIKARAKRARERLYEGIDYCSLALKNITTVPGFRKCDLVQEYTGRYGGH